MVLLAWQVVSEDFLINAAKLSVEDVLMYVYKFYHCDISKTCLLTQKVCRGTFISKPQGELARSSST